LTETVKKNERVSELQTLTDNKGRGDKRMYKLQAGLIKQSVLLASRVQSPDLFHSE
jgi:hypothetical protein